MKKSAFVKNAAILTASSLFLRFLGIIFKVWLAKKIGSEGIGLYQLVFSVYVLVSTFATTGICTAVTRLCAEEMVLGSENSVLKILKRAVQLSLGLAAVSVLILYFSADFISEYLLEDTRATLALKILPFSLPFMSISSCIRGYFIARRSAAPASVSQIIEQFVRIGVIFYLVGHFAQKGMAAACFAVMLGDVLAEAVACFLLYLLFLKDKTNLKNLSGRKTPSFAVLKKILHISVPITSGRYLNSLLRTIENLLVPKNLAKFPLNNGKSLSQFGMIKGMALPILFFPSAILNSVSTLLIPEIAIAVAKNQTTTISKATQKILKLTALISFIFGAIFFFLGEKIGVLIYNDLIVGRLLKVLSPIVPLMYLDSVSDGILKGLDQQSFTFRTSIFDSLIRIVLILLLLSKTGLTGFILIMYFSNFLTCFLNVGRLIKVSHAKFNFFGELLLPLIFAASSTYLSNLIFSKFTSVANLVYIILFVVVSMLLYFVLLILSGNISKKGLKTAINSRF